MLYMKHRKQFFSLAVAFVVFSSAAAQSKDMLVPKDPAVRKDTVIPGIPVDTNYYYFQYDTAPRYIPVITTAYDPGKTREAAAPPAGQMGIMAIQPHIPTSFEPDRNKNVGEIPIQESVSATGGLTYTVPIQLAPGRSALPVNVGMVYSSQGGPGYMGFGWALSGLSMIGEVSANIYYNTKTEPLKLSKTGQFTLDGMKLVKLSENSTQIEYQSEQGNIKAVASLSGNTIKYFNISYPNGVTAIYGYESNSVQQLYYPLTRMEDLHGNRVAYTYTLRNGQYYIARIEYGGTATSSHYASVEFTYSTRTDVNTVYSAGKTFVKDWLLSTIVCKSAGTALRTYSFTYQYANNTALLQKIDCSSSAGSLNPLQFYYGDGSTTAQLVKTTTQLIEWFSNITVPNLKVSKGKFDYGTDNDGLISYPNLNPYYEEFIPGNLFNHSKKEYINLFATNQALLVYQGLQGTMADPAVSILTGTGFVNMFSTDIDGKPGEELIKINNFKNGNFDRVEFRVYKANLYSGLALTNTYSFDLGNLLEWYSTKSVHPKYFYSGDFNGDGKMEILAVSCHNPLGKTEYVSKTYIFDLESGVKRHESTGLNFKIDYAVTSGVNDDILFPVDVDGDGKTDIMHIHDNGTDVYTFDISGTTYTRRLMISNSNLKKADVKYRQLAIGDLNGDGLPDILISPRESYYYYTYVTLPVYAPRYCSNGHEGTYEYGSCSVCYVYMPQSNYCYECSSYLNYQYNYSTGNWEYTCPIHGATVTVTRTEYVNNGDTWNAWYSKGNGSLDKKTITFKNLEQYEKIILQDVNRDNTTDVISNLNGNIKAYLVNNGTISSSYVAYAYVSGGNYVVPSHVGGENYHSQLLSLNNGQMDKLAFTRNDGTQRLATGVINSLGVISKTDYRLINEGISQYGNSSDWYTQGYGATFPYLNYQGPIAVVTQKEQWLKDVQIGGTSHRYSNAMVHLQGLGFTGFEKVYTTNELKGQTIMQTYDPLRYGILTKEESPAATVNYTYNFSIASNRIAKVWVTKKIVNDLLKGTTLTNNYDYDSYGYITKEINDYGGGLKTTTDNTLTYSTGAPYVLGVITTKSVVKERGGSSVTLKEVYTYNTQRYVPLTKTGYYNTNIVSSEEYLYDTFGNLTQEKSKPYSATAWLTTQYQYDAAGRFMTKKINPLSQATDYVYAGATATLTSEKDFKNNTTTYEYDGWQRLKKATNPNGTVKNITYEWQAAGSDRLYSMKEEFTGKPSTRIHYDALNRKVRNSVAGFDGADVSTDHVYDAQGRMIKTSLPYKTGSPLWNVSTFDVYDRITGITEAAGAITTLSYSGGSVTQSKNGVATTKTTDATGLLTSLTNTAGTINYIYKPDGQLSSITAPGGATTSFSYDAFGRQTQITDPSAGTISYTYDAAGNRNKITDANGKSVNSTYDSYNRLLTKTAVEITSTYAYNTDGRLATITNNNGSSKSFTYDALGRVTKTIETAGSETYQVDYTYTNGRLTKTVHSPMAYTINYLYNTYGYLNKLTDVNNVALKTINKMTVFGQVQEATLGNGLLQTYTFNTYGLLTGIKSMNGSTAVQNITYTVNNLKGHITSRKDETRSLVENFTYDNLDRLLSYGTSGATKTITYNNATGNITTKSDVGTYKYNTSGKPYAMSSVTVTSGNTVPTALQQVTYTSFARPKQLLEGNYTLDFTYDEDYKRIKQVFKTSGSTTYTRYYFNGGQYEKTVQGSNTKTIFYLDGSPYTATVALENNNGTSRLLYINRDHLGSITHITNAGKALQAEYSYDAWGRMRNPANLTLYAIGSDPALLLNRGYTGHEHLKEFSLINMNARLYDAIVGRMLSPDNFVQKPDDPMNFNRYTYAMNNPLRYNDPSGDFFLKTIFTLVYDFFRTGFTKGGFEFWNWGSDHFNSAWRQFDPTRSGSKTNNAFWIDAGRFVTDPNRNGFGQAWQIFSRLTWQAPQMEFGNLYSHVRNMTGEIDNVEFYGGATLVNSNTHDSDDRWGLTLGSYINSRNLTADPRRDQMFRHEYGHTLQSEVLGPFYIGSIGIRSLIGSGFDAIGWNDHDLEWYETNANQMALRYFQRHDPDVLSSERGGTAWDFDFNPTRYNPNWYWLISLPQPEFAWWLLVQ